MLKHINYIAKLLKTKTTENIDIGHVNITSLINKTTLLVIYKL